MPSIDKFKENKNTFKMLGNRKVVMKLFVKVDGKEMERMTECMLLSLHHSVSFRKK